MQMRPQIQIQSMLKALTDVVLPAVDSQNKLAQEQVRLVMGMLTLLAAQLPLQFRFDCDELARLIAFSQDLQDRARGGAGTEACLASLAEAAASAAVVLDGVKSGPEDIEHWVRSLRAASGSLVKQVYADGDPACRDSVRDTVLAMSKEQLLRERSMLKPQGWEAEPEAVPPIDSLLRPASH